MNNKYKTFFQSLLLVCFGLLSTNTDLRAQLILERELIGAAAGVATVVSNGGTQELRVDDSFGETMIGYEEGDIIITVGFQQTDNDNDNSPPNREAQDEDGTTKIVVNAFPNPTVERLTVDLGNYN